MQLVPFGSVVSTAMQTVASICSLIDKDYINQLTVPFFLLSLIRMFWMLLMAVFYVDFPKSPECKVTMTTIEEYFDRRNADVYRRNAS